MVTEKQYIYRGRKINRTVYGKYEVPGMVWGDQPGEYHTFSTLGKAQEFIDRQDAEKWPQQPIHQYS